jgi:hypothetical protein
MGVCSHELDLNVRPDPAEVKLERLNALDPAADRAVQLQTLRKALEDKHFRVVAKAATSSDQRSVRELLPDLVRAYARFLVDPVKRDPKCIAKQALARALVSLECADVQTRGSGPDGTGEACCGVIRNTPPHQAD